MLKILSQQEVDIAEPSSDIKAEESKTSSISIESIKKQLSEINDDLM